jgi:hypothetical protein
MAIYLLGKHWRKFLKSLCFQFSIGYKYIDTVFSLTEISRIEET